MDMVIQILSPYAKARPYVHGKLALQLAMALLLWPIKGQSVDHTQAKQNMNHSARSVKIHYSYDRTGQETIWLITQVNKSMKIMSRWENTKIGNGRGRSTCWHWLSTFSPCAYIIVMSAEAVNCDKLTGATQADALSLLEVVRLVWSCLGGLFVLVKVKIGNKGAAIRGNYLKQLQTLIKLFFKNTLGCLKDRLC